MPPGRKKRATASSGDNQVDVEKLSRQLGISKAAVEAMLAAQGAGVIPQASSRTRSRQGNAPDAKTPVSAAAGANAWNEFMADDAAPISATKRIGGDTGNISSSPSSKKSKVVESGNSSKKKVETKKVVTHKQYHLPVKAPVDLVEDETKGKGGVLLQTGTLDAKIPGRKSSSGGNADRPCDLWLPTLLCMESVFSKVSISFVACSSSACHSIALTSTGLVYGWGRNEEGQLGLGYHSDSVYIPKLLSSAKGNNVLRNASEEDEEGGEGGRHNPVVAAAVGKAHTMLVDSSGAVFAAGLNKLGQCGVNTTLDYIIHFKRCVLIDQTGGTIQSSQPDEKKKQSEGKRGGRGRGSNAKNDSTAAGAASALSTAVDPSCIQAVQVACGDFFTLALDRNGYLYSTGSAEFGQLGNGETGEYIVTAGKTAFANAKSFERRAVFVSMDEETFGNNNKKMEDRLPLPDTYEIRLSSIACGRNHSVAVEAPFDAPPPVDRHDFRHVRRVFSWGAGNYGCLGHRIQADEYYPRLVDTLTGPLLTSNQPHTAECGSQCSMIITTEGHVYYWGKHRSVGEATMRPTVMDFLANNGHVVQSCGGSLGTVVCSTKNGNTVSWGQGPNGELGYGIEGGKSSSKPKFVEGLDKCLVTRVACGYGHACFIVRNEDGEDQELISRLPRVEANDLKPFEDAVVSKKGVPSGSGQGTKKGKK